MSLRSLPTCVVHNCKHPRNLNYSRKCNNHSRNPNLDSPAHPNHPVEMCLAARKRILFGNSVAILERMAMETAYLASVYVLAARAAKAK